MKKHFLITLLDSFSKRISKLGDEFSLSTKKASTAAISVAVVVVVVVSGSLEQSCGTVWLQSQAKPDQQLKGNGFNQIH